MPKNKYFLYTLIASFLLLSCTDTNVISNFNEKNTESDKIILTPEEFTSIAYDAPQELSDEEITNVISDFKNNIETKKVATTRNSKLSKVVIKKKYYITQNNNIIETITTTRSSIPNELAVPIFNVELPNDDGSKSLAVVCGDERMPEVLFYTDNYCPDSETDNRIGYLLEVSKKNILLDIQHIEDIKSTKRDSTLYKIAQQLNIPQREVSYQNIKDQIITTDEVSTRNNNPGNPAGGVERPKSEVVGFVNPLSKVEWSQNTPYNSAMPVMMIFDDVNSEYEGHIVVGCANLAIGMLFSIIKPAMSIKDNQKVDWNYVTSVDHIVSKPWQPELSSPQDLIDMISGLLYKIYVDTGSHPAYEDKVLQDIETGSEYTKSVITQTETPTPNMINYLRSMTNFSGDQKTKFDGNLAKQSLFERKPVFLFGSGHIVDKDGNITGKLGGHAWLIDGVVITRHPRRAGYYHYWSVNIGWGIGSKAYFRTSNNLQDCDVIFKTKKEYVAYYTQEMTMLYNITRK